MKIIIENIFMLNITKTWKKIIQEEVDFEFEKSFYL